MDVSDEFLEKILLQATLNDSSAVQEATAFISKFTATAACLPRLMVQMRGSNDAGVRHLAAVTMRNAIQLHWERWEDEEAKEMIKTEFLTSIGTEQDKLVRGSIATAVGIVASREVPLGRWNGLLEYLQGMGTSKDDSIVLFALHLYRRLLDTARSSLNDTVVPLVISSLTDAFQSRNDKVLKECIETSDVVLTELSTGAEHEYFVKNLLTGIVNTLEHFGVRNMEDETVMGLSLLDSIVEFATPSVSDLLGQLLQFTIGIASSLGLCLGIRVKALDSFTVYADVRPSLVNREDVMGQMITCILPVTCEPDDPDYDLLYQPCTLASQTLDYLALKMSGKMIWQLIKPSLFEMSQSDQEFHRRGVMVCMVVLAEGCEPAFVIDSEFASALRLINAGLRDSASSVRMKAALALGQFATHLNILEHHGDLLDGIISAGEKSTSNAEKEAISYGIEAFCGGMSVEEISPYVQRVLGVLYSYLVIGSRDSAWELLEVTLSAVSSVAKASKHIFEPFAQDLVDFCLKSLKSTESTGERLRGRAMECLSYIYSSVLTVDPAFLAELCEHVLGQLHQESLSSLETREYCFIFFANMAGALSAELLDGLSGPLYKEISVALDRDERQFILEEFAGIAEEENLLDDDSEDGDGEEDLEELKKLDEKFSAAASEKVAALQCLREVIFKRIGSEHLLQIVESVAELSSHADQRVRDGVYFTLTEAAKGLEDPYMAYPIVTLLLDIAKSEAAVMSAAILNYMAELLSTESPLAHLVVAQDGNGLVDLAIFCFARASGANASDGPSGAAEDAEDDEERDTELHMNDLKYAVINFVTEIVTIDGPKFSNKLPKVSIMLEQLTLDTLSADILGFFAEVLFKVGETTPRNLVKGLLDLFLNQINISLEVAGEADDATKDILTQLRRNCCFGIGMCYKIDRGRGIFKKNSGDCVQALMSCATMHLGMPLYESTIDNAISAIGWIIRHYHTVVPIDSILAAYIERIPLIHDNIENEPAMRNLLELLSEKPQLLQPIRGKLIGKLRAYVESNQGDELSDIIMKFLQMAS